MKTIELTEDMFKTGQPVAQGEVLIWMTKYAPKAVIAAIANLENLRPMKLEKGQLIMGHSESGHHHVIEPVRKQVKLEDAVQAMVDAANDSLIKLTVLDQCMLIHLRKFDTHAAYMLPPGDYIRGLREEQTIEGWRRSAD